MLSLLALLAGTGVNAQSDPLGGSPNTKALRGSRPNVVIFFIDDTGWGDYSFNDPSMDDTPHLQRLRERGMRLSDFHAAASVCTPSRASLMTGRLGIRSGVKGNFGPFSVAGLPMNETTIPEVLRDAGYVSAMAGKWHLGHNAPHGPLHRGFDRFLGLPMSHDYGCTDKPGYDMDCPKIQQDICSPPGGLSAADDKSCHIGPNNPWNMSIPLYKGNSIAEQPTDLDILSDRYAAFARDFVVNSTAEGKPFFLYIAWNHMHVPVGNHKPKFTNTSKRGVYGDSLRQLDESIGIVVDAITGSGAENNTLILLTGDNGAPDDQCDYGGSNGPFMGAWLRKNAPGGGTGTWPCPAHFQLFILPPNHPNPNPNPNQPQNHRKTTQEKRQRGKVATVNQVLLFGQGQYQKIQTVQCSLQPWTTCPQLRTSRECLYRHTAYSMALT